MAMNNKDHENGSPPDKDLPKNKGSQRISETYDERSTSRENKSQEPMPSTSHRLDPTEEATDPYQKLLDSGEDPKLIELKLLRMWRKDIQMRELRRQKDALDAKSTQERQSDRDNVAHIESQSGEGPSGLQRNKKKGLPKPQQESEASGSPPGTPPEVRRRRVVGRWRCAIKKVIRSKRNKPE